MVRMANSSVILDIAKWIGKGLRGNFSIARKFRWDFLFFSNKFHTVIVVSSSFRFVYDLMYRQYYVVHTKVYLPL